jgi:diaminopimelate decarboxylase
MPHFLECQVTPRFADYSAALQAAVPELFDANIFTTVVTEFGRALAAKNGFFASRVEYVKVDWVAHCLIARPDRTL